jgi:tRNA(fMet)-specific endonuclease VapC
MAIDGYLLDTGIVGHYFCRHVNVIAKIESLPDDTPLFISAITRGEIEFGHCRTQSTDHERRAEFIRFVRDSFRGTFIIPVTKDTGAQYGELKAKLFAKYPPTSQNENHPELGIDMVTGSSLGIDENDLWIASQAIQHNLILVTADNMTRIKSIADGLLDDAENWTEPI